MRDIWGVVMCVALAACAPTGKSDGQEEAAFAFSSFLSPVFEVRCVDPFGKPLAGVSVTIEDAYRSDGDSGDNDSSVQSHAVYLRGVTDSEGVFVGTARLPRDVATVDIVVHDDSGRIGPWTDTALRDAHGDFAPSSRQTRSVAEQGVSIVVALTEEVL